MNKEDIIKLGATAELAEKINEAVQAEYVKSGNYVPKAKFDEVNQEKANLKAQLDTANAGLKSLKEGAEGNDALKKTIQELQDKQKADEKRHKDELSDLRKRNAIMAELSGSAHNPDDIIKFVDLSKITVSEDGKIQSGWAEQRDALIKDKSYLFKTGTKPGNPYGSGEGGNPNSQSSSDKKGDSGAFDPEAFAKSLGGSSDKTDVTPDYFFGGGK